PWETAYHDLTTWASSQWLALTRDATVLEDFFLDKGFRIHQGYLQITGAAMKERAKELKFNVGQVVADLRDNGKLVKGDDSRTQIPIRVGKHSLRVYQILMPKDETTEPKEEKK